MQDCITDNTDNSANDMVQKLERLYPVQVGA